MNTAVAKAAVAGPDLGIAIPVLSVTYPWQVQETNTITVVITSAIIIKAIATIGTVQGGPISMTMVMVTTERK